MRNVPEEAKRRLAVPAAGRPAIPPGKRRYLVHLRDEVDPATFAAARGIACERTFVHALKAIATCLDDAAVEALRDAPEVQGIAEDCPVAEASSQTVPAGVKRMGVEQFPAAKINGLDERVDVDVAVLDTGTQADHPDLNVYRTFSASGTHTASDHGTAVAGVIGALDNEFGTVGVAPGARIWAIAPISYESDVLAGFEYVAEHADEIEVLNCSFGDSMGQLRYRSSQTAVRNLVDKGVVVVCAAGNNSADIAGPNGVLDDGEITDNFMPAGIPEAMAVSAVTPLFDKFASYSNFSATNHNQRHVISPGAAIDVAAPTLVLSTAMNSSYWRGFNGTSCASPHASGLVALYISIHGRAHDAAGVYRIRQAIVDAAQPQSSWQTDGTLDPDSNPEGLATASPAWLDPAPRITRMRMLADRVEVEATTVPGYLHVLQDSPTLGAGAAWAGGAPVAGTGLPIPFSHRPTGSSHFYRMTTKPVPWPQLLPTLVTNVGTTGAAGNASTVLGARSPEDALAAGSNGGSLLHEAADFGGGTKVPWLAELAPAGAFAAEVWVKPSRNSALLGYSARFLAAREPGGRGWHLNQYPATNTADPNGFSFTLVTGGTSLVSASAQLAVEVNKWYHIVGVFDGVNLQLYIDGSPAQSVALPAGRSYLPPLRAGVCFGSDKGERWFEGGLDEAAFYPFALSAVQVQAHYQAGISASPSVPYQQVILNDNPAGYWRFNEP